MISIQAPRYWQYALISDFLDFAYLSIREEAALATNWFKDLGGLKLQNLALATMTGPAVRSQPKNTTADLTNVSHWAQGDNGSFTGIHRQLHGLFSAQMAVLRRHF